jgi:hypothetical protein
VYAPTYVVNNKNRVHILIYEDGVTHGPAAEMILETHPGYTLELTYLGSEPPVET